MSSKYGTIPEVKVGQIWESTDPRQEGRRLQVQHVLYEGKFVIMRCIADTTGKEAPVKSQIGKLTRIAVARLRPTRNGYRLVEDG